MSRSVKEQGKSFRGVVVYKKTEPNPDYIPGYVDPETRNWVRQVGNARLYLDEPGWEKYLGPYSRKSDVTAAFRRDCVYEWSNSGGGNGKLLESIYSIRVEEAELVWKTVTE